MNKEQLGEKIVRIVNIMSPDYDKELLELFDRNSLNELERLGLEASLAGNKFSVSKYIAIRRQELSTTKHNTGKE